MASKQTVGGPIAIYIDGVKIRCKSGAEYSLGVPQVTPVMGVDEKHGDKETPEAPMLKVTTTDTADLDLKALLSKRNATVFMEKPNGKGVVYSNCSITPAGPLTTDEGEVPLNIYASKAEEV